MAFTLTVSPVVGHNSSAASVVTLNGCTAGNTVIIGLLAEGNGDIFGNPTCSGESPTLVGSELSSNFNSQFAMCSITSSGNKTFTQVVTNNATPNTEMFAFEVSGAATFDNQNTATGTGANSTLSLTTGGANALISAISINKNGGTTQGAGYQLITLNGNIFVEAGEYLLDAGAAGANTVNFTHTSAAYDLIAVSFIASGGGGDTLQVPSRILWI